MGQKGTDFRRPLEGRCADGRPRQPPREVQAPLLTLWPGLAIAPSVLGLNLLGNGLRDVMDPKLGRGVEEERQAIASYVDLQGGIQVEPSGASTDHRIAFVGVRNYDFLMVRIRAVAVAGGLLWAVAMAALAQVPVSFPSPDGFPLKAWHYRPTDASSEPRPVIIALHGCTGLYAGSGARKGLPNARHHAMGEMLASQGYHAVFPDSFGSRGIESICSDAQRSTNATRVRIDDRRADVLATLEWARTQTWADTRRNNFAVLGWSHGGITVLAATDATHPAVKDAGRGFKAAIAFYPGCIQASRSGYTPNTELTLLLGAEDDWTLPEPCLAMAEALRVKGFPVETRLYPGAVHGFDWPLAGISSRDDVPSQSPARKGRGVLFGQNPQAREDSWKHVRETLARAFATP